MPALLRIRSPGAQRQLRAGPAAIVSKRLRSLAQLRALARSAKERLGAVRRWEKGTMKGLPMGMTVLVAAIAAHAADAPEPPAADWRDVDANSLVLIDTRYGQVAVELA